MTVSMSRGIDVELGSVADLTRARGPRNIRRQNQKAAVSVHAAYEGEDTAEINKKVAEVMSSIPMPAGYTWTFGRSMQRAQEQQQQMLINVLLALACVYLVMAALFESLTHPLVIMSSLPFAFLGVVWTLVITNTPLNIMTMIGLVILVGIVVNNGIVLLDHINNFRKKGLSMEEAIMEGGRERFRPILMTAATTILGLVPMALGDANVGGLGYFPLARSVMGGLAASTILTLLVLPTFYSILGDMTNWSKKLWGMSSPDYRPLPTPTRVEVPDAGPAGEPQKRGLWRRLPTPRRPRFRKR
jgi:HAE1 family hydrophobic/amphiphilic exporter-1